MEYKNLPNFKPWNYEEPKNEDPWCLNFRPTFRAMSDSTAELDDYYQRFAYQATRSALVFSIPRKRKLIRSEKL